MSEIKSRDKSKQSGENTSAGLLMMACLQNVLNTQLTLNSMTYNTKTKVDISVSFVEGASNPIENATETGLTIEEWQKNINTASTDLAMKFITENIDPSVHELTSTIFSTYDGPRSPLSSIGSIRILKCKRKKAGMDFNLVITAQEGSSPSAPVVTPNVAVTAPVVKKVEDKKTETAPVKLTMSRNLSHVAAQSESIVDVVFRELFSSGVDVQALGELIKAQMNLETQETLLPAAGKNKKALAKATEAVNEARAAVDNVAPETKAAYEKLRLQTRLQVQKEVTMFKNEAYSAGLKSVKNRDELSHNHRR